MVKPASFSTICTSNCAFELIGLLLSLSVYHTDERIYILCDTKTKQIIGDMTPAPKLDIYWFTELDKYDGMDRHTMVAKNIWSEFQMAKATVIEYALKSSADTMLLDSDIVVTDVIDDIDTTKDLGVSPQFITQEHVIKTGYYNGGTLWTKNKNVPSDWIEFTKKSRYFDQASIEDLAKKYSHFEFGENYNLQCWRMLLSTESQSQIAGHVTSKPNDKLYYKNKPLKYVHTHFLEKHLNVFNDVIIKHLKNAKMYKILAIVYRIINKTWMLTIPIQPKRKWDFEYHNNDSYRELILLMKLHNNDVDVKYTDNTIHCWLEPDILTYDRPTLEWCNHEVTNSSLILLGNGDVNIEGKEITSNKPTLNVKPWMFWPRCPKLLENILKDSGILSHDDRTIESVFIGNIENVTQRRYRIRPNYQWNNALTEYHCTNGYHHKFTHEEYLLKLRNSRYGLCLRGYGSKCHREVELMAFGTVPIMTPEVTVSSYMEPLIENTHYILVTSPDDLASKLATISTDKWSEMSKECYEWYQRNVHSKNCWNNMITNVLYN